MINNNDCIEDLDCMTVVQLVSTNNFASKIYAFLMHMVILLTYRCPDLFIQILESYLIKCYYNLLKNDW